jgi:hypothetical protein
VHGGIQFRVSVSNTNPQNNWQIEILEAATGNSVTHLFFSYLALLQNQFAAESCQLNALHLCLN